MLTGEFHAETMKPLSKLQQTTSAQESSDSPEKLTLSDIQTSFDSNSKCIVEAETEQIEEVLATVIEHLNCFSFTFLDLRQVLKTRSKLLHQEIRQ